MIVYGVIIAAGYSIRMNKFKPLAVYNKNTFINNIIIKLNTVCERIIIVTGYKGEELKNKITNDLTEDLSVLKKIVFAQNINFDKGMFSSIKTGISKCPDSDWVIIHQVDQPGLPEKFYDDFINEIETKYNWVQPEHKNKLGHPILLNKSLFSLILNEKVDTNLKTVSRNKMFIKKIWECNYKEILQDIDTDEDYQDLIKKRILTFKKLCAVTVRL